MSEPEDIEGWSAGGEGPVFILHSSDPSAYMLVWIWARMNVHLDPRTQSEKTIDQSIKFAMSMYDWLHNWPKHNVKDCPRVMQALFQACGEFIVEFASDHLSKGEVHGKESN